MIPLRDVIPSRTTPWVTMTLMVLNGLVFFYELGLAPDDRIRFFFAHGLIPAHFTWLTAVTAMFLHDGWLHIGGNLLSLWIFGDNVEDRMGHGRFILFYLLAGLVAGLAETMAQPGSTLPVIGASGAIAGVMGAYLVMFPHSRILVLIPIFLFFELLEVPAVFFLGFWFLLQILGGVGRIASASTSGGVAFWAHAGGFLTGLAGALVLRRRDRDRVEWWNG
jgi:membrane associated rhomboid family serine protease